MYYPAYISEINIDVKIIISTEKFTIEQYQQWGLELEPTQVKDITLRGQRDSFINEPVQQPDWTTHDLRFIVQRPAQKQAVNSKAPAILQVPDDAKFGESKTFTLKTTGNFVAQANLTALAHGTRDVGAAKAPDFVGRGLQDFMFADGLATMGGINVLQLDNVSNMEAVTRATPLEITLPEALQNERIVPFGYDAASGWYFPLGGMSKDNQTIRIAKLPDYDAAAKISDTGERSIGGSLKIFFSKVFTGSMKYPLLQTFNLHQETSVDGGIRTEYITSDADVIKKQVVALKKGARVVVFIHGILGDTEVQVQALQRATCMVKEQRCGTPKSNCGVLRIGIVF